MTQKNQEKAITENTTLSVSILSAIITALVLGILHVQGISQTANTANLVSSANASEIVSLKEEDKKIINVQNELILELSNRLARIEGALGLPEYKKK